MTEWPGRDGWGFVYFRDANDRISVGGVFGVGCVCWCADWCADCVGSFPAAQSAKALDGRLLLLLSNDPSEEPRMQIDDTPQSQMVFGVTVDGMKPGQSVVVGDSAAGYPVRKLSEVPAGDYTVQAVLDVYETFHRADGKTMKLSPDRGEGKHWNIAPGNLYSKPRKIHVGPGGGADCSVDGSGDSADCA